MNAHRTVTLLFLVSACLAGCPLESTNPISTPSSISIDRRLLGMWHWKGTDKRYHVEVHDNSQIKMIEREHGDEVVLIAHTSLVNDVHYLNVRFGGAGNTWSNTYFFRYDFRDEDTIILSAVTIIAFEKLRRKPQHTLEFLAYHGTYAITDKSENIARFLAENDKELVAGSESRILQRVQQDHSTLSSPGPAKPL